MDENNLKDEGATYLSYALRTNTNIKDLHLARNGITDEGRKNLLDAVFDTSTLDSIMKSNHACKIHHDKINATLNAVNDLVQHDMMAASRNKISWYLGIPDTATLHTKHFKDVPLELMPNLVISVQKHVFQLRGAHNDMTSIALKNVFKLFRYCVVPLLCATKQKCNKNHDGITIFY